MNTLSPRPLLLYDGTCGFCAEVVRFILRRDKSGTLKFASLQGAVGRAVVAGRPELAEVDSVIWVDRAADGYSDRLLIRSDAALRMAGYLGGAWTVVLAARVLPRAMRDAGYDLIARHRHRLAGASECVVPTPEQRSRFLD